MDIPQPAIIASFYSRAMIENQEKTLGCLGKAFPKLEDSIDSFLKKKKKYINKASMKRIWEGKSRRQGRGMGE